MNTLLFIFHNTLTNRHLDLSLQSLFDRQTTRIRWDRVVIHNTHSDPAMAQAIQHHLSKHGDQIGEVDWLVPQGKSGSLHQDLRTCFSWIKGNVNDGFILVLKGDYAVSTNFNETYLRAIQEMGPNGQWSLPIYNAKEHADDWDILEKLEQPYFQLASIDTYYRCGTNPQHTPEGEVLSTGGKRDDDHSVKFVAHNVLPDYNLHVFGWQAAHAVTELYDYMPVEAGWNCVGFMFKALQQRAQFYNATRAFGVHTFHAVDRGDPRKMIPGERY